MPIPCGKCYQCVSRRQTDIIQRAEVECRSSWAFFATLTYNPESLPILQLGDYRLRYADIKDLQDMFKRLRVDNVFGYPFKYLAVSERGTEKGRPHFHLMLFFKKSDIGDSVRDARNFAFKHKWTLLNYWKRNLGDRNHVQYQNLTTYRERYFRGRLNSNYDFHFVEPALSRGRESDVSFYVTSYMISSSEQTAKLRYALQQNYDGDIARDAFLKLKDKCVKSIGFGVTDETKEIVRSNIDSSVSRGFPVFQLNSGSQVPLSKYYRDRYFTVQDMEKVYFQFIGTDNIAYDGKRKDASFFFQEHYPDTEHFKYVNSHYNLRKKAKQITSTQLFNFLLDEN